MRGVDRREEGEGREVRPQDGEGRRAGTSQLSKCCERRGYEVVRGELLSSSSQRSDRGGEGGR